MLPPTDEPPGAEDPLPDLYYYASSPSPLGELWLAATQHGICGLWIGLTEEGLLSRVAGNTHAVLLRDAGRFAEAFRQLGEYLTGGRRSFHLDLDLRRDSTFQRRVWATTEHIPYGEVRTYGQIARAISSPGAARAVGRALGDNPVPIIIPCHRVVRTDGSLGGYGQGPEIKRALLALEGQA